MANLKIDTSKFDSALNDMLGQSKRDAKTVIEEQGRGFIKKVVALTPPSRSTKSSPAKALKIGKATVAKDVLKVLSGVPMKQADEEFRSEGAIKRVHRANRKGGRVKEGGMKVRVPKTLLNIYIKKQQAKVGRLAAGWKKAAEKLGAKLPKWVSKHNTNGGFIMKVTNHGLKIIVSNASAYATAHAKMPSRVQHALDIQANAMRSRVADFEKKLMAKAARRSGFKAGKSL